MSHYTMHNTMFSIYDLYNFCRQQQKNFGCLRAMRLESNMIRADHRPGRCELHENTPDLATSCPDVPAGEKGGRNKTIDLKHNIGCNTVSLHCLGALRNWILTEKPTCHQRVATWLHVLSAIWGTVGAGWGEREENCWRGFYENKNKKRALDENCWREIEKKKRKKRNKSRLYMTKKDNVAGFATLSEQRDNPKSFSFWSSKR